MQRGPAGTERLEIAMRELRIQSSAPSPCVLVRMEEDAAGKSACWPLATAQRGSRAEALVRYVEYCASPLLAGSDTPGALTHLLQILLAQRREIILSSNSNEFGLTGSFRRATAR